MRQTKKENTRLYQRNVNTRGGAAVITPHRRKQLVTFAALTMVVALLLASLIGAFDPTIDFTFAEQLSGTAATYPVGTTSTDPATQKLAYGLDLAGNPTSGVNSMVGKVLYWNKYTNIYLRAPLAQWMIYDQGYNEDQWKEGGTYPNMPYAKGPGDRSLTGTSRPSEKRSINYYIPANNDPQNIRIKQATPAKFDPASKETIDQFNSVIGEGKAKYGPTSGDIHFKKVKDALGRDVVWYTIEKGTELQDWTNAIIAASFMTNSGIYDNEEMGGVAAHEATITDATEEFPEGWNDGYFTNEANVRVTPKQKDYLNVGYGPRYNNGKDDGGNNVANYTYIGIQFNTDWTATPVTANIQTVRDQDSTYPMYMGTSFAGADDNGKNRSQGGKDNQVDWNQWYFCPALEGVSWGRLAIPDTTYVILDLNGKRIDRGLNESNVTKTVGDKLYEVRTPSVFQVGMYSRLDIMDSTATTTNPGGNGKITGGYTSFIKENVSKWNIDGDNDEMGDFNNYEIWAHTEGRSNINKGGGITVKRRGEVNLHSGTITGNMALLGGAYYGMDNCVINQYDAVLTGNAALAGGASYLSNGSRMVVNMFGGLVDGNMAITQSIMSNWVTAAQATPRTSDGRGGGLCVFTNAYLYIYGGRICNNYAQTKGGGICVDEKSFVKFFGGEVRNNLSMYDDFYAEGDPDFYKNNPTYKDEFVDKGIKNDNLTTKIFLRHAKKETNGAWTGLLNGGGGIFMSQNSAGIYINGPIRITDNYICDQWVEVHGDPQGAAGTIAGLNDKILTRNSLSNARNVVISFIAGGTNLLDSNLFLSDKIISVTDGLYKNLINRDDNCPYADIKVQGPLVNSAGLGAQVYITPALGDAGGNLMRTFREKGWSDVSIDNKDGVVLGQDQYNDENTQVFNYRRYLCGYYPDGFFKTDSKAMLESSDEWIYVPNVKGAQQQSVTWQYYDEELARTEPEHAWRDFEGNGFINDPACQLDYRAEDMITKIRALVVRKYADGQAGLWGAYLYYDHYEVIEEGFINGDNRGSHVQHMVEGKPDVYYLTSECRDETVEVGVENDLHGARPNIFVVSRNYVKYEYTVDEAINAGKYRFRIDIDGIKAIAGSTAKKSGPNSYTSDVFGIKEPVTVDHEAADLVIERANLVIGDLTLTETKYYDGTTDVLIDGSALRYTGLVNPDLLNLSFELAGWDENKVAHATLDNPNVGFRNATVNVVIKETSYSAEGYEAKNHEIIPSSETLNLHKEGITNEDAANAWTKEKGHHPKYGDGDFCLLTNYYVFDSVKGVHIEAEKFEGIPITVQVNVVARPITVDFKDVEWEYGSIPLADDGNVDTSLLYDGDMSKMVGGPGYYDIAEQRVGDVVTQERKQIQKAGDAIVDVDRYDDPVGKTGERKLADILGLNLLSVVSPTTGVGKYSVTVNYTNTNYNLRLRHYDIGGEQLSLDPTRDGEIVYDPDHNNTYWKDGESPVAVTWSNFITVTPRNIQLTVPNKTSIYGEPLAELEITEYKHLVSSDGGWKEDDGGATAILSGDSLNTNLRIVAASSNYNTGTTNGALMVGDYAIALTAQGANLNPNYNVVQISDGAGKVAAMTNKDNVATYTVTARKITISPVSLKQVYGDDPTAWSYNVTATAVEGNTITGDVILNSDRNKLIKFTTNSPATDTITYSRAKGNIVGRYQITLEFHEDNADKAANGTTLISVNYEVKVVNDDDGNDADCTDDQTVGVYEIVKRIVNINIVSSQSSVYGENFNLQSASAYWQAITTTNGDRSKGIIIADDIEQFNKGITLSFVDGWGNTVSTKQLESESKYLPVGRYAIKGEANVEKAEILKNYDVVFTGEWDSSMNETYPHADGNGTYAYYSITKRPIIISPSTLSSEYGDDLVSYAALAADGYVPQTYKDVSIWTPSCTLGDAVEDGMDAIKLAAEAFKLMNGNNALKSTDNVSSAYIIQMNPYESLERDNPNYSISFTNGQYSITARKVELSSQDGYTIYGLQQGGEVVGFTAKRLSTTDIFGAELTNAAPFVSAEGTSFSGAISKDSSGSVTVTVESGVTVVVTIVGYTGNRTNQYLNAGTYTVIYTYSGNSNYNVTTEGNGNYTVLKRAITIQLNGQTAAYTGREPLVDQAQWSATAFFTEYSEYGSHEELVTALRAQEDFILTGDQTPFASRLTISKVGGVNAGDYNLTASCSDNNYYINWVNAKFTITAITLKAYFAGYESSTGEPSSPSFVYDRASHELSVVLAYVSGSGVLPSLSEANGYTVTYAYTPVKAGVVHDSYKNAGTYKVTVKLVGDAQTNYNFGTTDGIKTEAELTFTITRSVQKVNGIGEVTFNRSVQLPIITFTGNNGGATLQEGEWGVYYVAQQKYQEFDMPGATDTFFGVPSYADIYNVYVMLLDEAQNNFAIDGANSDNRTLSGDELKGGTSVSVITSITGASDSSPKTENLTGDSLAFAQGCLWQGTYTIDRLHISLRQGTSTVVYDYAPTGNDDKGKEANPGRHLNTALEVDFYNVGGAVAAVNDVPYQIYILNDDGSIYAVFHYTLGMGEGNYAHLGKCSAENHSSAGESKEHQHMHFTYAANGMINWGWDNSEVKVDGSKTVGDCIQELRSVFTNVGKHTLVLVLDNGNYIIEGEGNAFTDSVTKPDWYNVEDKISQSFTFEITKATINPFLFDSSDDAKTPIIGSGLQITFDGKTHRLWVWFTNSDSNTTVLPDSEAPVSDEKALTATNYWAQFGYEGWAGTFSSSTAVKEGTHDYIDVGTYTVHIALKENGNFQLVGGATETTLTYNINTLSITKDLLNLELSHGGYTMGADTITGKFVYVAKAWEPITKVYIQVGVTMESGGTKTLLDAAYHSLQYLNNLNQGTAEVQISGTRNYSGTISLHFTISPKSLGTATQESTTLEDNDSEIAETLLKGTGYVYNGGRQAVNVAFTYSPKDFDAVSMTSADYTLSYYVKGADGNWNLMDEVGVVQNAGTYRIVAKGKGNYADAYVVEFTVSKATVALVKPASKTYNRNEQDADISFTNLDGNSVVPKNFITTYSISANQSLKRPDNGEDNAQLKNSKPYYAGKYDVTITLTGEDLQNFQFRVEGYDEGAPAFTDKTKSEFEITQLKVHAIQELTSATYDGKTHFFGNGGQSTYGGVGAWTLTFTALDGRTGVSKIGYTIKYKTPGPDGKEVVVRFGGDLAEDQFTYDGETKSFSDLQAYNLFRDVVWISETNSIGSYSYTASFDHANFVFAEQSGGTSSSMNCTFRVNPAVVALDSYKSKVYNALVQEPDVRFTLVNAITGLSDETVNSELKGCYELEYSSSVALSDGKPINVGIYNVTLTLTNHNYAFNSIGGATHSQQYQITPLNIVNAKKVEFFLENKVYTGTDIESKITEVSVTIGDKDITFKTDAKNDNEVELNETRFKIIGYNNNTHVGKASATIQAGENFSGTITVDEAFTIAPRNIIVRIKSLASVYGEALALSNVENIGWEIVNTSEYGSFGDFDWNWKEDWSDVVGNSKNYVVYRTDSLGIDLNVNGAQYNVDGGALLVGTYSITNHSELSTSDYNITFVGDWKGEDGDALNGKAGTYTVNKREIVVTPTDARSTYGEKSLEDINSALTWSATSNYAGDAVLTDDYEALSSCITLTLVTKEGDVRKSGYLGAGSYAIEGKFAEHGNAICNNYTVKFSGSWQGEGEGLKDKAGTYTVDKKAITLTIAKGVMTYEYDGEDHTDILEFGKTYVGGAWRLDDVFADGKNYLVKKLSDEYTDDTLAMLGITLTKDAGATVGDWSVTHFYTSADYDITFENTQQSVKITPRKIVIHINDKTIVYGESEVVGTTEGKENDWYAMLSKESTYWTDDLASNLEGRIALGRVGEDNLGVTLTKESGTGVGVYYITGVFTNGNYEVTWEGSWTKDKSTTDTTDGDPADGTAGVYTITQRKVQIVVLGQRGVYGGNQHEAIEAVKNINWKVGKESDGFYSLLSADDLGILLKLVFTEGNKSTAGQLNVGWYAICATYTNANYDVTFVGDNTNLKGALYVEGLEKVESSNIESTKTEGGYNIVNLYYIFARRLTVTIKPQTSVYNGLNNAPTLQQGAEWWSVVNELNGSVPPVVKGDGLDLSVELSLVNESDIWKVGTYNIVAKIGTTHPNPNYIIDDTSVNGVYTITPKPISVLINDEGLSHEYDGKSADEILQQKLKSGTLCYDLAKDFTLADGDSLESLGITLSTSTSSNAGSYQINGSATNENYEVTFVGSWEATNKEKTNGTGGTYTITQRELVVVIKNHTSVYGEELEPVEGSYTIYHKESTGDKLSTDNTLVGGDDLEIRLSAGGISNRSNVGQYNITATWNNNSNYAVTFYGANYNTEKAGNKERQDADELNQSGHTTQNYGLYFITPRLLNVHINDQGGVFGGLTYTNLNELQGTVPGENGWYITDFTSTNGISESNKTNKNYVMPGDSLAIDLILHNDTHSSSHTGKYAISATCGNGNYKVTFDGTWNENDDYKGVAGTFEVSKRKITVTVADVTKSYDGKEQSVENSKNFGWTEVVTNDPDNNTVTFVPYRAEYPDFAPQMTVSVSVSGAKNVNTYAIHIVITRNEVVIFNSATTKLGGDVTLNEDGSVTVSTNEYEITVVGTLARTGVEGDNKREVKVCGTYTITPKDVRLTIEDYTDTYGEITLAQINAILAKQDDPAWNDLSKGIVDADREIIKQAISLTVKNRDGEELRDGEGLSNGYINAGTYYIHGVFNSGANDVCRNYNITFTGMRSTAETGILTINKRDIGLRVNNKSSNYGDEKTPAWDYTEVLLGGTTGSAILESDKEKFDAAIKFEILNQQLSSAGKLNVGNYPIWMSIDETKDTDKFIANNYNITFTGFWTFGGKSEWANRAGVYTVGKKQITVTSITGDLTSEYGDEVPTIWEYTTNVGDVLDGDKVTVVFSTDASNKANVGRYLITVDLGGDGADNDNYSMVVDCTVYYTIVTRKLTVEVEQKHTIVYGDEETLPDITTTRTGKDGNWQVEGDNVSFDITLTGEMRTNEGHLRVKSGGYNFVVYMHGDDISNYEIDNNDCSTAKYFVTARPVKVTIADTSSVYGEKEAKLTYSVESQSAGERGGRGLIADDEVDVLNIILTRSGLSSGSNDVAYYAITGQYSTTDYDVTFVGNWGTGETSDLDTANDGKAGIYQITVRDVRIKISNNYSIYGETISVNYVQGADWIVADEAQTEVDGTTYYPLKTGDNLGIELFVTVDGERYRGGVLDRGNYNIGFVWSNKNYNVTLANDDLDTSMDDFKTGEGDYAAIPQNPTISDDLNDAHNGIWFVTVRPITVHINDQQGVYGDYLEVSSLTTGQNPAYIIQLGEGTSGNPVLLGQSITFTLVTTAIRGADINKGLAKGESNFAGEYPIFGSECHAGAGTKITNYRISFSGNYEGDDTYESGTPYFHRTGVFTVQQRNVVVRANDVSAVYGTYKDLVGGTFHTFQLINQKGYSANATNSSGNAFVNDDEELMKFALSVQYNGTDLSTGHALKVGSYTIVLSKTTESNALVNSYNIKLENATLTVTKADLNINIASGQYSTYGDKLTLDKVQWSSKGQQGKLYTIVGGGYVEGDELNFTLLTSLIDYFDESGYKPLTDGKYPAAGNYPIYVSSWTSVGDNANYNMPTYTGSFMGGIDPDDSHYANIAGIYTIRKKAVEVTIDDKTVEYGDEIGSFGYQLPEGWKVGNDADNSIRIALSVGVSAGTPVGTYAITGTYDSDNYEVKFAGSWLNGEAGTLKVSARKIVVVLRQQQSVYGYNPSASSSTEFWFVVKDKTTVTSATESTSADWRQVFGINTINDLDKLLIILTKGTTARDRATNGTNDGNGLYGGVYDIIGQCNNSNYNITFTKFVAEDTDYGAITANSWGEYKINPRKITIVVSSREAVYGSTDEAKYGAVLNNTKDFAWSYAKGSEEFVTGHEQFLSFYLIGKTSEKDTLYVPVGSHNIVAYWADGIGGTDDANYRLRELCYTVEFENSKENKLFTVTPATILQKDRAANKDESFSGTLWNKTEVYRGDKFSLVINEEYLTFAGNVLYNAQTLNNKFDSTQMELGGAQVTYKNLSLNGEIRKASPSSDDLKVEEFGVWTVTVCISNDNHESIEFTLTLTIMQAELTVTLDGTLFTAEYGLYLANGVEPKDGVSSFEALEQAVKEWLFSTDKMVITAIAGGENLFGGDLERIIKYLAEDGTVGITVNATSDDVSEGRYLDAKLYSISFVSVGNINIKFDKVYSVVSITKKDITVDWVAEGSYEKSTYEVNDVKYDKYTYNYDGKQHLPTPNTKGVLDGDSVANKKYGYQIYLLQNGSWNPTLTITTVGLYRISIVVDYNTQSENNLDIGNYNVIEVDVYVEIKAVNITVTIHDQSVEYGEEELNVNTIENAWEISEGKELLPDGEDLLITLILEGYSSSSPRRPVGNYVISGDSGSSNYEVKFVNGTYSVTKRKVTVTVHDLTYMYGSNPENPDGGKFNFADLGDRAYSASRPGMDTIGTQAQATTVAIFPDDLAAVNIQITLRASDADYTSTGYLKANAAGYGLLSDYNRIGNYNITFVNDHGNSDYAKLTITQRTLNVNIQTRTVTYGDARPTMPMNYSVVGWMPKDETWFSTNRDTPVSFLSFAVLNTDGEIVDATKDYDPVGKYIIQLVSNTAEDHEIGSNYALIVTGEWDSDEYFVEQNGKAGIYTVNPKPIAITVSGAQGEYGDDCTDLLGWELISRLAGDETSDVLKFKFDVSEVFLENNHTKGIGIYKVWATIDNPNYVLDGEFATTYEIVPRHIDIIVSDQSYEYGDRHGDFIASLGRGVGWTAQRTLIGGEGIAYDDDLIVSVLKLYTDIGNEVFVNDYVNSIDVNRDTLTDRNYSVNNIVRGTLHVVPREITIRVTEQRSEYGEDHPFSTRYNEDWTAVRTHNPKFANSDEATVLISDIYDLRLFCDVDRTSPAGSYTLRAVFENPNYNVTTVEGNYVITPRKITVTLENATSEYGDGVGTLTYRVSRTGGNALVNGDELDITLKALLPSGASVDGTTYVGRYPIVVTVSNNPNYEITFVGEYTGELPDNRVTDQAAVYEVTRRQIIVTFDGESEYGDEIDPHGASYRANGKSGPAIVNGDDLGYEYVWIDNPQAEENLVGGYPGVGEYRLQVTRPSEHSSVWDNYDVQDDIKENSVYRVVPRKVTITVDNVSQVYGNEFIDPNTIIDSLLHFARTTEGKSGNALVNDGDITADNITVAVGVENRIWFVDNYAMTLTYAVKDDVRDCYEVTVVNGDYVITPRPITVHINSNTAKYGDEFKTLTHEAVEGLQAGDDLNILLQVLWLDGLTDNDLHNVGIYAIGGTADNPNYTVTFEGSLGRYGAYVIEQADNFFTKQYTGDGDVNMGDPIEAGDLPTAKWGNSTAKVEYYLDEEMTILADFDDIVNATAGTYYVKVTVDESLNWKEAVTNFVITVINQLSLPDGLDITTYVMIYASQFVILTCALIFIRRWKGNKKQNIK